MFTTSLFKKIIVIASTLVLVATAFGCKKEPAPTPQYQLIVNGKADFSIIDKLTNYTLTTDSKELFRIKGDKVYCKAQGACTDGTYVYGILRDTYDTGAYIKKCRLDTGELVATSAIIPLGHGNDMTYDSKNNRLVVAHGTTQGKILTLVNADDLSFIEKINLEVGAGAITYNEKRDCYAISQGGKTLHFLDSNFNLIRSLTRTLNEEYVAQGMGCDDNYIYFPMSNQWTSQRPFLDNILEVYDWDGNYITTVHVPLAMESESMFWANGKYYVAYNNNGTMPICEAAMKIEIKD